MPLGGRKENNYLYFNRCTLVPAPKSPFHVGSLFHADVDSGLQPRVPYIPVYEVAISSGKAFRTAVISSAWNAIVDAFQHAACPVVTNLLPLIMNKPLVLGSDSVDRRRSLLLV